MNVSYVLEVDGLAFEGYDLAHPPPAITFTIYSSRNNTFLQGSPALQSLPLQAPSQACKGA